MSNILAKIYTAILQATFPVTNAILKVINAVWSAKDTKFGKMIGWSACCASMTYITGIFWAGVKPALTFFQQIAKDPSAAFTGLPESGVLSLSWIWDYLTTLCPEALRWFLWWIGADWWVWLAMSSLAIWFAGWLLSKVGQWMGAIVERVCQLL